MTPTDKPLVWLSGEIKTPPFSEAARQEAGMLLRRLQRGEMLSLPHSRPMPRVGKRCHEIRIADEKGAWRIMYRLEPDAVVILDVFRKTTPTTPKHVVKQCQRRLRLYQEAAKEE